MHFVCIEGKGAVNRECLVTQNITRYHLKGRDHLEDLAVDGRTLKLVLEQYKGSVWSGLVWLKLGTSTSLVKRVVNSGVA